MKLEIRKYSPSEPPSNFWKGFLEKWNESHEYPEVYIGLMHAAANFICGNHSLDNITVLEIMNFFLFYSVEENEGISQKARQLLLGKVLPKWHGFAYSGAGEVHRKFQTVFAVPRNSIRLKVYRDSMRSYLMKFRHLLVGNGAPLTGLRLPKDNCRKEVQHLLPTFVHMAIEWHMVEEVYHSNVEPRYKIWELERILEEYLLTPRDYDQFPERRLSAMFGSLSYMDFTRSSDNWVSDPRNTIKDMRVFLLLMNIRHVTRGIPIRSKDLSKRLFD